MRLLALLVFLVAGCTHVSVQGSAGGGATTTATRVSAGYHGHGSAAAWAIIGIGLIAAEVGGSEAARARGLEAHAGPTRPMSPTRSVNEVDCTRPIGNWSANLKCR